MATMPTLSVLELALRERGRSVQEAISAVIDTAIAADRLGYCRFWLSEHHQIPAMSTPAPAVVASRVAAATENIRVGAGGIMLPNYSPLATAETFASLNAMFPGRIDLGLGRGPGTYDEDVMRALRGAHPRDTNHIDDVREVLNLLDEKSTTGRNAFPDGTGTAVCWLLASSPDGARMAGELGLPLAVAHFLNPDATAEAAAAYRGSFQPSAQLDHPWLAISALVVCASTEEELQRRAQPAAKLVKDLAGDAPEPLDPASDPVDPDLDFRKILGERGWVGTSTEAAEGLRELAGQTTADEVHLVVPVFDAKERIEVLELIASAS